MSQPLAGMNVLVTGAGGGIGTAVVEVLKQQGARVAATDITAPASTSADLSFACDVTDSADVAAAVARASDAFGGLNGLAYITGVLHEAYPIADFPLDKWDWVFDVNLKGMVRLAHAGVPELMKAGGGSIVSISSWWGFSGHAYFAAYCASKAGVRILTQSMADELAASGIRVNSVAPGNIDTSMHRDALTTEAGKRGISFQEMKDIEWKKIPMQYAGPPTCIADAVAFLLSPQSSYITGATIDVNGGVMLR
jgi:3-oxoacyl-[acyl-carrier protein] reductase